MLEITDMARFARLVAQFDVVFGAVALPVPKCKADVALANDIDVPDESGPPAVLFPLGGKYDHLQSPFGRKPLGERIGPARSARNNGFDCRQLLAGQIGFDKRLKQFVIFECPAANNCYFHIAFYFRVKIRRAAAESQQMQKKSTDIGD